MRHVELPPLLPGAVARTSLLVVLLGVAGCAAPSQVGPAVVVVAPVGTAVPTDPATLTTPTKVAGADCTPSGIIHVTIAPVTNETGRDTKEIEGAVMPPLAQKIAGAEGLVLTREHVAGRCEISLVPVVRGFAYEDGKLAVRLVIGVRWRSDGSPIGSVDKKLTKENVPPTDRASELQVLTMAAELAAESFVAKAHAFTDPAVD